MSESRISVHSLTDTNGKGAPALSVFRYLAGDRSHPLTTVSYESRVTVLKKPNGEVVFDNTGDYGFRVPTSWSILSGDIAAEKYGAKAGCSVLPDGRESGVDEVVHRVVQKITTHGLQNGYFISPGNSVNFQRELEHLLINQYGAFNSPVWFNVGLDLYGRTGSGGNYYWNQHDLGGDESGVAVKTEDAYTRPQSSACFILKRTDDLDSIYQGVKDEARLFKYGSGAGSNFSLIRSKYEFLSGGGTSSGLMSFLKVYDAAAGSLKSGGTTRRAAKMVVLNDTHPEILDFVKWKSGEEKKAKILEANGYSGGMEGEALLTVSGQNSNNSVCFSDEFMSALASTKDGPLGEYGRGLWSTRLVTTGAIHQTFPAADLWRAVAVNTWECGDPGVHFGGTINAWHTCPNSGPINASNPCSEYLFLDDTACNLASLNLLKYVKYTSGKVSVPSFDIELFQHHCRLLFIAQEILVGLSSYPTPKVAENSYKYRPLGLGHCNGGMMLMTLGIPYDSEEGRTLMGAITSLMTGTAYHTSTMLAQVKGPFEGYEANKEPFMAVMGKHRQAHWNLPTPYSVNLNLLSDIRKAGYDAWDAVIKDGALHGFRNAQATVLAPTGTIGFLMGAETTGIEPLYSIVMTKKYAGGSYRKIVCEGALAALSALPDVNYPDLVLSNIIENGHVEGSGLPEKYWPIFATAGGQANVIPWKAHVEMMAACQPFLSGAISKTVNMPQESTVEDIEAAYLMSYQKGIKAVAIYRDGSKSTQPLNTEKKGKTVTLPDTGYLKVEEGDSISVTVGKSAAQQEHDAAVERMAAALKRDKEEGLESIYVLNKLVKVKKTDSREFMQRLSALVPAAPAQPVRDRMADKAVSDTYRPTLGGQRFYLHVGLSDSGKPLEVFVRGLKMGGSTLALIDAWCIAVSCALQYGMPLSEVVDKFTFLKFEPAGGVQHHSSIRMCSSIIDLIARILGYEYLGMKDLGHVDLEETPNLYPMKEEAESARLSSETQVMRDILSAAGKAHNAPLCDNCGHLTQPNGKCHRCPNCGHSMGCS